MAGSTKNSRGDALDSCRFHSERGAAKEISVGRCGILNILSIEFPREEYNMWRECVTKRPKRVTVTLNA